MKTFMSRDDINKLLKDGYDMPRGWRVKELWRDKVYRMWKAMRYRCYLPASDYYKDSLIYNDFKIFSNYLKFIIEQPRFEEFCSTCHEVTWCIDKDIKHPGNRNYYPEYMSLITQSENSKARIKDKGKPISRRPIIGINKDTGKVLLFKSKSEAGGTFDSRTLHRCLTKKPKYKSHRGYKWYYINYKHNKIYRRL